MGGFGGVVKPVVKDFIQGAEKYGAKELPNWWTSFQTFLSKSETGKVLRQSLEGYEFKYKAHAAELMKQGINPEDANIQARERMQRIFFGHGKENIARAVNIARAEKGPAYAQTVADNLSIYFHESTPKINNAKTSWRLKAGVNHQSPYQPTQEVERNLRHAMSYMFTSRIAIPHLTQGLNSALMNGWGNTSKAVIAVMKDKEAAKEWVLDSGALFDEALYNFRELSHGKPSLLTKLIHQPGFKQVRNMQLIVSALAGKYSAEGEFRNLLRNPMDKGSRVQLKLFGLDPEALLKAGKLEEGDLQRAAYKSAAETMFIRSELQTPPRWDATPLSRALSMYKHFTFNEGRFIKDMVVKSAKQGPTELMKTMATLAIAFPMAGEVVKTVELLATGNDPQGERAKADRLVHTGNESFDEYVDALGYAAGFGMFYSMLRASNRNAMVNYLSGPILGFLGEFGQDIFGASGIRGGHITPLGRSVTRRIPVIGPAVSNTVFPYRTKTEKEE